MDQTIKDRLKGQPSRAERLGIPKPLRAIREKCLDCCCGSAAAVKACTITRCALHPYRMGRWPKLPATTNHQEAG